MVASTVQPYRLHRTGYGADMRAAARVTLVVLMLAAGVVAAGLSAGAACACSCVPMTAGEAAVDAAAIVQGRAVAESVRGAERVYEFEVDVSYKSRVHERIEVATSSSSASCGVVLEIGRQRTLVLSHAEPLAGDPNTEVEGWSAGLCSNLSRLDEGVMPASAGPRLEPLAGSEQASDVSDTETTNDAGSSSRSVWLVTGVVLAGVVVVAAGVVIAARGSRR